MRGWLRLLALAGVMCATMVATARAEDFYKGKTLTIAVGAPAGAIYDIEARLFGRHLAAFIPGAPTIVVQNMVGASGMRVSNYLFNAAPKDGTFVGMAQDNVLLNPFLAPGDVKYRPDKFEWIGRGDKPTRILYAWAASGIRSIADAKARDVPTGVVAPGSSTDTYSSLAKNLLGARFVQVTGYEGAGAMNMALERGEIEAVGANSFVNLAITKPEWIRDRKIQPIFQMALERDALLADTPTLLELCTTDEQRDIVRLLARAEEVGFFLIAPPDTPADRAEILRTAFTRMTQDADYLADAKAQNLGTHALSGADLQALATIIAATPADLVARFKNAIASKR